MIYKIIKEDNKEIDFPVIIEYCVTKSGKIYLFTEEDLDPALINMQSILNEGKGNLGGYPPVTVRYSGSNFKVELIPEEDFNARHSAARVKIYTPNKSITGTRRISFSDDDPICKRGALSIYRSEGEKFSDSKDFRKSTALSVGRGVVYALIDDFEKYYNKEIDREELQRMVDEKYSNISKSKQDYYNNIAEGIEKK